jgi:hypothetical protein
MAPTTVFRPGARRDEKHTEVELALATEAPVLDLTMAAMLSALAWDPTTTPKDALGDVSPLTVSHTMHVDCASLTNAT